MLLPEVSDEPDPVVALLRESCAAAVALRLVVPLLVVVGRLGVGARPPAPTQDDPIRWWPADAPSGIDGFLGRPVPDAALPLALSIGRALLLRSGYTGRVDLLSIHGCGHDILATAAGHTLTADAGLLVIGDGSATRTEKSPGHAVPGAVDIDDRIADALATADTATLSELPDSVDTAFLVNGRAAWQAAAAMVSLTPVRSSRLVEYMSPHGVAYFVAVWETESQP